jgi:hypothetical protein
MLAASHTTFETSFAELMDEYCDDLRGTLIDLDAFNAIQKQANFFPLDLSKFWCLEIPLEYEKKTADLLFCISDAYQCSHYFLEQRHNFSSESPDDVFLPGIENFSRAWYDSKTFAFKNLVNIWFEYDFDNIRKSYLKPNFFYAPLEGMHPLAIVSSTETIIKTISGKQVDKGTLVHLLNCLHKLPAGAWISQIGRMFARNEDSVRVFIQQIPCNGIRTYLDNIRYPYAAEPSLIELLNTCYMLADQVDLDIDILHTTGDTIGLECTFNVMQTAINFLDHLSLHGFCIQEKHAALSAYLKEIHSKTTKEFCPFLSHFKMVYHPARPVKTKAYLGYASKASAFKIIRTKPFKS